MRTTVDLDQSLLERAKRLAIKERRPMSAVLNSALAAYLGSRRDTTKDPKFELIVRGKPQARFPTPAEIAETQDEEDRASLAIPRTRKRVAP